MSFFFEFPLYFRNWDVLDIRQHYKKTRAGPSSFLMSCEVSSCGTDNYRRDGVDVIVFQPFLCKNSIYVSLYARGESVLGRDKLVGAPKWSPVP